MKIDVYLELSCPWCYLGKKRLDNALVDFSGRSKVEVVYHPFQLDSDLPTDPAKAIPYATYMAPKLGADSADMLAQLQRRVKQEGITFNYAAMKQVNTNRAHRLLWLAGKEGNPTIKARLLEGMYQANFVEGRNLADVEVLVKLATEAGLNSARARQCLAGNEGEKEVQQDYEQGRAAGVKSLPAFLFPGQEVLVGALKPENLRELLGIMAASEATAK